MEKTRKMQTESGGGRAAAMSDESQMRPLDDVVDYMRTYAREQPEMAALWCFGIGFVLGWKLKPW